MLKQTTKELRRLVKIYANEVKQPNCKDIYKVMYKTYSTMLRHTEEAILDRTVDNVLSSIN